MVQKKKDKIILVAVGDCASNRDDPPSMFRYCRDAMRAGDIVFGQMENPMTDKGIPQFVSHKPHRLPPSNITAYTEAGGGFSVMSFAANAAHDYGAEGLLDTIHHLNSHNIAVIGAGKNIEAARKPAILERKGTKVGFLGYLSITSLGSVAEENVAGSAPLRATHFYQQVDPQPGTPPLIITKLFPEDRKAMEEDIKKLRPQVDVLVVSAHCGVHFVPMMIPMYQKEAAYAAIDAGADMVLMHHAHILKGIEVYKGKTIFYSLNNFADEHGLGFPGQPESPDFAVRGLGKFYRKYTYTKPAPDNEKRHGHPDAKKTIMVKAYIENGKIQKVTYSPAYILPDLEPEIVKRSDPRAKEVFEYIKTISEAEELKVGFSWEGDEVLISEGK